MTHHQDTFGINKIYADSDTPFTRVMDMNNPAKDAFLNKEESANMRKEADGGWSLDGKDTGKYQVRLGLWMKPAQVNIEATVYSQYISAVEGLTAGAYAFQLYKGVGNHSTSNYGCTGFSYKGRVRLDKSVVITKEIVHPEYAGDKGGLKKLTKDPKGNYIGTKIVTYNLPKLSSGRTPVKIEVWCDEEGMDRNGVLDPARQNWVKMAEYVDQGGWSSGSSTAIANCEALEISNTTGKRKTDEIYNKAVGTTNGNIITYRTDRVKTKIKFFSVRAIKPVLTHGTFTPAVTPEPAVTPVVTPVVTPEPEIPTTVLESINLRLTQIEKLLQQMLDSGQITKTQDNTDNSADTTGYLTG